MKSYYESHKFKKIFQHIIRLNKPIIVLKLEDFKFEIEEKYMNKVDIYDLYKYRNDNYEGYEMRKFINTLNEKLARKLHVSVFYQYKLV